MRALHILSRRNRRALAVLLLLATALLAQVGRAVPLEVYGRLPANEDVALSPDGSRLAFVRTTADQRLVLIYGLKDHKQIGGLNAGSVKLRGVRWADNDHLLIITSVTAAPVGLMGPQREWHMLRVYDVATRKVTPIPDRARLVSDGSDVLGDRVHFISHSADFKQIVVRVDGPAFGYLYDLFDMDTLHVVKIGDVYRPGTRRPGGTGHRGLRLVGAGLGRARLCSPASQLPRL